MQNKIQQEKIRQQTMEKYSILQSKTLNLTGKQPSYFDTTKTSGSRIQDLINAGKPQLGVLGGTERVTIGEKGFELIEEKKPPEEKDELDKIAYEKLRQKHRLELEGVKKEGRESNLLWKAEDDAQQLYQKRRANALYPYSEVGQKEDVLREQLSRLEVFKRYGISLPDQEQVNKQINESWQFLKNAAGSKSIEVIDKTNQRKEIKYDIPADILESMKLFRSKGTTKTESKIQSAPTKQILTRHEYDQLIKLGYDREEVLKKYEVK